MKTMKFVSIFLILAFVLAFHEYAEAQYTVSHSVFGNGGAPLNNGSYRLVGTVGQPAIGMISSSSNINNVGFWYLSGGLITSVEQISNDLPTEYRLEQNYPNPFNPSTTIEFSLPKSGFVTLKIYNSVGEEIATLISAELPQGKHKYIWDASRNANGVYLCWFKVDDFARIKKLVLLK